MRFFLLEPTGRVVVEVEGNVLLAEEWPGHLKIRAELADKNEVLVKEKDLLPGTGRWSEED